MVACTWMPALRMRLVTCAPALTMRRQVDMTLTTRVNGRMALTNLGKNLLAVIPMAMGSRTTYWIW